MCHRSDFIASYSICLSFMNKNFMGCISVTIPTFVQFTKGKNEGR